MMKNLRLLFAFCACLLLVAAMLFLTAVGGSATTDDIGLAHISSAPEAADKPPASDIETQPRKQVEGPSSKLGTVTPDVVTVLKQQPRMKRFVSSLVLLDCGSFLMITWFT